ncbi:MAG: PD-(D/E)XK nuclease family protein, partial [Streptococcus sp.]|nr:PD-(D/E)XK nuclease family protein [Streptococcus sp.]
VFALGMTQSHFPKVGQNKSLLSDEERSRINEATDEHRSLDIVTQSNSQRGHFVAMSLFNAASEQLVLSQPQILNETQDDMSVYLKELLDLGLPLVEKGRNRFEAKGDQIGNYKDLLSTVIALNSSHLDADLDKETQTFWSVAVRYLRKRLDKDQVLIPNVIDDVTTTKVDDPVMQLVFPGEEPLKLSASALTTFYNNQYLYFLRYVLGLEELESIHPDARHHGTYLHRVFERVMGDSSSENFDDKLEKAIAQTNQEQPFELLYTEDQESRLSRQILEDIARSTASVLRDNAAVKVEREEAKFDLLLANSIKITGIIDRVDRLTDGALGVVDYKSGKNVFDIQKFYNGLSPQLVTYLEALRQTYKVDADQLFGAMYLHMQDPQLNLAQFGLDKLAAQAHKELTYKGLFVASETEHLAGGNYDLQKTVTYDKEDLETLLDYNIKLFTSAAEVIRSGNFAVNPYTEDGKSVQGDQIKAITHFEADRHMGQARKLLRLPSKGKKEAYLELMAKDEDDNEMQVAETIVPFPVTDQAVTADNKDQEDNHVD